MRNRHLGKVPDDLYSGLRVCPADKHLICYLEMDDGMDVVGVLHGRWDIRRRLP